MNKNPLKEWFIFTKSERNAAFMLLLIIALLMVLPYLVPGKELKISVDRELQQQLDEYNRERPANNVVYASVTDTAVSDTAKHALFFFDPNTLYEEGFVQLGLSPKLAHTFINYRNKGGHFKSPEDIRKIYGLSQAEADRLIPYVRIASYTDNSSNKPAAQKYKQAVDRPTGNNTYKKININTATAEEWKAFPGIGDVLANRIVKFRTSVGGFKSIEQVSKTYGLNDSTYQFIKPYLYISDSTTSSH